MRILLTGVGCPGALGTMKALINNPREEGVFILGVDAECEPVGKYFCNQFQRVSFPEKSEYIHVLQRLYEVNNIDLIVPQTTRETVVLSEYKGVLNKLGVNVMVNDHDKINRYNSKHLILLMCKSYNLPCVDYKIIDNETDLIKYCNQLGYPLNPVVIKPLTGSGGRGVRILDRKMNYEDFINMKPDNLKSTLNEVIDILRTAEVWPEMLVMGYLPGREYSVDVLNTPEARIIIPRIRNKIRSGISFVTEVVRNEEIERQVNILLDKDPLYGVFGFQFKEDELGVPHLIECNPRIQGTMVASYMADVNIIWAAVEFYRYGKLKTTISERINPVKFFRYWGGVGIREDSIVDII